MSGFSNYFNSTTLRGRANTAKLTYASIGLMYLFYRIRKKGKDAPPEHCLECANAQAETPENGSPCRHNEEGNTPPEEVAPPPPPPPPPPAESAPPKKAYKGDCWALKQKQSEGAEQSAEPPPVPPPPPAGRKLTPKGDCFRNSDLNRLEKTAAISGVSAESGDTDKAEEILRGPFGCAN